MPDPIRKDAGAREERRVDAAELEYELGSGIDAEVRFDTATRALYVTDGSNYRQEPIGVVLPRTVQAAIDTVAVCRRHGAPIVSRGAGTALAGQTCNVAVVIDYSKYLNKILEIDPVKQQARVQPGVILDHLREEAVKKHKLTFGPDPATHNHCTLGGMIGNNSCGIHSVMAGRTADNVHELDVLTYDGLRLRVGPTSEEELGRIIALGGRRGEIYRKMRDLRDKHADEIRRRYPPIPRRVSGYNLDQLLPENGFHVARALVGTESTCVTVLEATVRLVHNPPARTLLVLGYPSVYEAGDHVTQVMEFGPVGLEGIDDELIGYMKKKKLHVRNLHMLPEGKGWLLVEFGGETKDEADARARKAMEALKRQPQPPNMKLYDDIDAEHEVWELRESGLGATANVPGLPLTWPGWEDAAVPPDRVGGYLRDFKALLGKHGLQAALYGHFGQGCIHCRITFDLFTHDGVKNYMRFVDAASDLVHGYGGSFSGEHGDGQSRAWFLPKMYGPELVAAFREFKAIWDPEWKMNPGKVVEPHAPDQDLRLGPGFVPWQTDTHFSFPADGNSFPRATLRCVGVGKCRRTHRAFMCPSFLATREELHTTRGRAHMLFEMFRGDLIKDRWRSKAVRESLDLCLGCKGCKTECPVNVDLAVYKSEFLSHHYQGRLRPRSHYAMGLVGYFAPLGGAFPRLSNLISRMPGLSNLLKFMGGFTQKRPVPRFARETFTEWFRRRESIPQGRRKVMVFPDLFNDLFYPQTLKAAVLILERWGYTVVCPPRRPPPVRPLLHFGWLKLARKKLARTLEIMHPYLAEDVPIVVMEPSTASVFRDEMPLLMPADEDARRMSRLVFLIDEFVKVEKLEVPKLAGKAIFHGHCHQKAVLDPTAARELLKNMGLDYEEPQPGCCGVAGAFGLESRHYDVSMKIGEEYLLPAVRKAAEDTYVVIEGFSCRTQISDGTGREPMHMSELLRLAFEKNPPTGSATDEHR